LGKLIVYREGRPQSQFIGSVAPTVRLIVWWHNFVTLGGNNFYVHFCNGDNHGKSFISFWIATGDKAPRNDDHCHDKTHDNDHDKLENKNGIIRTSDPSPCPLPQGARERP
jgi:hypothetical protein